MINSFQSKKQTYRLKFTGTKDKQSFERECAEHDFWYHSFYFDNGFQQRGDYDIGQDIGQYGFPKDMSGMSVLDIGTGSGWFATYFEQLGADVTTVDARGFSDFDVFGRYKYPDIKEEKTKPDKILSNGQEVYYSSVSKGFWIMKEILGLKADYVNARIYDICPELFGGKTFDLVFLGSLLMHVRDPIGALMAVRSVCKDRIISNTLILDVDLEEMPVMMMLANEKEHPFNWWQPNKDCVIKWFKAAGFSQVNVDRIVNLTTDKVYVDPQGKSSGCDQKLYLVDAFISNKTKKDQVETPSLQIQQQPLIQQQQLITEAKLLETQQQLQQSADKLNLSDKQLQIAQVQVNELKLLLTAIESSKFWKLRRWWFNIKQKFNRGGEDMLYENYLSSINEQSLIEKFNSVNSTDKTRESISEN